MNYISIRFLTMSVINLEKKVTLPCGTDVRRYDRSSLNFYVLNKTKIANFSVWLFYNKKRILWIRLNFHVYTRLSTYICREVFLYLPSSWLSRICSPSTLCDNIITNKFKNVYNTQLTIYCTFIKRAFFERITDIHLNN